MVFTLHRRGLFLCLFIKRIFLVRTLCDHYLHKVFTKEQKSRQGQYMSAMELYDLYTHEDKSPCPRPCRAVRDPVALSRCATPYTPRPPQNALRAAVSIFTPSPVSYPTPPQNAPRAPQNARCDRLHTHTRPSPAAHLCTCAHCSNLHNVDRSTLCKAPKVRKLRKNTCKTA